MLGCHGEKLGPPNHSSRHVSEDLGRRTSWSLQLRTDFLNATLAKKKEYYDYDMLLLTTHNSEPSSTITHVQHHLQPEAMLFYVLFSKP